MSITAENIPRYAPPTWAELREPETETCGNCVYYRDVYSRQGANGYTHCIGICIFEVFQADTFAALAKADPVEVNPTDESCTDYKESK